ncbi:MAG: hypothetical protein ACMXYE_00245 [Candidatus Woesearchaeota archaeon]
MNEQEDKIRRIDIMNYKILTLITITFVGVILAGCGAGEGGTGPSRTPFAGGANGLSLSFMEGAPPNEVFDAGNFPFSINVRVENLGEHTVGQNDGYIEITGINPEDFGKRTDEMLQEFPQDIRGVVKNHEGTVIIGETVTVDFQNLNYERNLRGNWDGPRIRANACYNYETEASTAVCLKQDMLANINSRDICSVSGQKPVYNSGAPIHISKVEQTPVSANRIQVQFEIRHVGSANDRIYRYDTECDDRPTNNDKNKVFFEIPEPINGNYAECSGLEEGASGTNAGFVTLPNREPRVVICAFDVGEIRGGYEQQVTAHLRYRYSQFIERNILIRDVTTSN